jgi:hypothetical protein
MRGKRFISYIVIYLVIFITVLSLLFPRLFSIAYRQVVETTGLISEEFQNIQSSMQGSLNILYTSPELSTLLQAYTDNHSPANAAYINLALQSRLSIQPSLLYLSIESKNGGILESFNYSDYNIADFLRHQKNYLEMLECNSSDMPQYIYSSVEILSAGEGISGYPQIPFLSLSKRYMIGQEPLIFSCVYDARPCLRRSSVLMRGVLDDYMVLDEKGTLIYVTENFVSDEQFRDQLIQSALKPGRIAGEFHFSRRIAVYYRQASSNRIVVSLTSFRNFLRDIVGILILILFLFAIPLLVFVLRIYRVEKQNEETKYKLLLTQIDPHFIYNTMNIINIKARQRDYKSIIGINSALTRLLQERLGAKQSIFATIEKEIYSLNQYTTIMKYRYRNKVEIFYNIDEGLIQQKIPKNLLQPLVENAYYHGMLNDEGIISGIINISIYRHHDDIIIEINDNGKGIDNKRLRELVVNNFESKMNDRVHIGLENIRERLKYIYHEKDCISIKSEAGKGTTVTITLKNIMTLR